MPTPAGRLFGVIRNDRLNGGDNNRGMSFRSGRNPRVAIFSAVFGKYDDLKPARPQSVPTDYYLFTDQSHDEAKGWSIKVGKPAEAPDHPRLQAKWFKLHPHRLFPNGRRSRPPLWRRYDYTIWVDASMLIESADFARDVTAFSGREGIATYRHPWRDCIYEEASASMQMTEKYGDQPIAEQVAAYRSEGFPEHAGLAACGVLVRNTQATHLPGIDEMWWREILQWTYQDQLSLPVVFWRAGRTFNEIPGDIYASPWFRYVHHRRND